MFQSKKSINSLKDPTNNIYNKPDYLSTLDINDNINEDIEISSTTIRTLEIMKICKRRIITPFNIMLIMIGWRPIGSQMYNSERCKRWISFINILILSILIVLVVFSYTYQILTCRFIMSPEDKILPAKQKTNTDNISDILWNNLTTAKHTHDYVTCNHLYSTYVIPNIIHFIAYLIGIFHYRYGKNEDIYGLMEKALQYSTSLEQNKKSQYKVTTILTTWMVMAVIWVILSGINHVIYDVSYNTLNDPFYNDKFCSNDNVIEKSVGQFLFVVDFVGYLIISIITIVVLLNYTLYCELVKFYIKAISKKIEMRCIKLNVIKNDIHIIGIAIELINGGTGTMTTLIFLYNLNMFVGGLDMLLNNETVLKNTVSKLVFRVYFVIHLIPLILVPLIQCVRINRATKCFNEWAMHMSVFGYRKEKRKDLDSFLLYTVGYKAKAKLISIPLQWSHLCIFFLVGGFVFLSIIQAGLLCNLKFIGTL